MANPIPLTEYAPAERVPITVIQRQHEMVRQTPLTAQLLNSVLNYVFILNQQRQIVFVSDNLVALLHRESSTPLLGLRPGEALGCTHALSSPSGCGTTQFCQECGAMNAILASLTGQTKQSEFHLTRMINCTSEAWDLLVYAVPFTHCGETFSIFSIADISHQKRRRALERVFFHDIINSTGSLEGLANLLKMNAPTEMHADLDILENALHNLLEEILIQKDLASAENNELTAHPAVIHSQELLEQIVQIYQSHPLAKGITIQINSASAALAFTSDPILLRRVIANLLKNALEATNPGQTVTLSCEPIDQDLCFWVHNPAVMAPEIQRQIFVRSFTTKGEGRGLGTYSVKMLVERYLRGAVHFVSAPEQGTTFRVRLPLNFAQS